MAETCIVSIGRNIGNGEPMPDADWGKFRELVFSACERDGDIHFFGDGYGVYDGAEEESYTVIFTPDDEYNVRLIPTLSDLAVTYGQECIAVTYGDTHFVYGGWGKLRVDKADLQGYAGE